MSNYIRIAHVNDVPENGRFFFDLPEETVILFNIGGQYYCIADLCTHDEGPLEDGALYDYEVECPRHGARFDVRTGKATCFPATEPVPAYPVKVKDDYIYIQLPQR